ncbi:remorin 4.1-like [Prosopis cineraria]|uniref:remorin 4.1-like n=1 Tax=Prosopis cineraria TaxID=364024 RepID=UPI00240EB16C|nr:remorin 4.1-like [Prosopis cineraria]
MLNDHRASTSHRRDEEEEDEEEIREIHALTPPRPPPPTNRGRRRDSWETHSRRSSSLSVASTEAASVENFTSMSREFSALVMAGSSISGRNYSTHLNGHENEGGNNLGRIREEDMTEETNPLAIVPDPNPLGMRIGSTSNGEGEVVSVQRVKKEEVEAKISAWQNAKIAKINNRFKREDAVISGWESDQVQKATSWMKKVERKLEEKRAKALEKMQNGIAKARRKAEEKRASAEGRRGTKVAKILEIANLMRAVGKFPAKRSFF